MPQDLIDIAKTATLPAPLNSSTDGELWVWGDYVLVVQTKPQTMMEVLGLLSGSGGAKAPVEYPVVVSAFYRMHRNPHGPSARPILVATLEVMDYAAAAKLQGLTIDVKSLAGAEVSPLTLGLFSARLHSNHGVYKGGDSLQEIRAELFSLLERSLQPEGEPVKLGPISAIHGHPETGWPAKKTSKGCAGMLMAGSLAFIALAIMLRQFVP